MLTHMNKERDPERTHGNKSALPTLMEDADLSTLTTLTAEAVVAPAPITLPYYSGNEQLEVLR